MNAANIMPIANPVPSDEESEDVEALAQQLEAAKAKNIEISQRKKEWEAKHLKEAKEEKEQQEAEAKRKADEAEAKRATDEAEAK